MTVIFFNGQLKNRKTRLDVPLPNIAILLDKIYYHVHLFFCAPKWEEAFLQVVCYLPFFLNFGLFRLHIMCPLPDEFVILLLTMQLF